MIRLFLCVLLCYCGVLYGQGEQSVEVMTLNNGWEFARGGSQKWLPAIVPGTVQQDLIRHSLLPDPFDGMNEGKVQWVEREDWEYRICFRVSKEQLERDAACLTFEGLDTYADVYLNGALVMKGDNMFVGYKIPVKELLREGENYLYIYFHSPIKQTLPQGMSNGFEYPADNDHWDHHLSVFSRKAPYSYGWDWGIRLVTSGIWRPAALSFYDIACVDDFYVRQLSLTDSVAKLSNELTLNVIQDWLGKAEVSIACTLRGEKVTTVKKDVILLPGENRMVIPLEIVHPERWMPNGWGKPVLYDLTAYVRCEGKLIAERHQRIGLRTIRLVNEKDEKGESFYFEVNEIPMFAKGANYIPSDAMLPTMTEERYRTLFQNIQEANMNIIRVWGGGTYEADRFYDLADENGILVWQDFMFACTSYPSDPLFLQRVEEEAEYNIRRLRNHPCLSMWCGNNEILEGLKYWGWQRRYEPKDYKAMCRGYDLLFRRLLPSKVEQLDSGRFYIHGSPSFANWGRPDSWCIGDSHNWGVWYGEKPFESLDVDIPRFMSEFGFQSFPEMKTIASFASPKDYRLESEVMNAHQKSSIGNALIRKYMERDYIVPDQFDDFVYVGLVMQGRGMRRGLEAHRRNRPYCMGSMYWQLNDSWPVVSWSGIDYYGNWKALHYQVKRAFASVVISCVTDKDSLSICLLSDRLDTLENQILEMQLTDFNGKIIKHKRLAVRIPANTSLQVYREEMQSWVKPEQKPICYLLLTLKNRSGQKLMEETYFFNPPKDLNLPNPTLRYRLKQRDGVWEMTLTADKLAKDVFIEIAEQGVRFSDNFFDLLPGEKRKITISSPLLKKDGKVNIRVRHLAETMGNMN